MSQRCPYCGSETNASGSYLAQGSKKQRYKCIKCNKTFSITKEKLDYVEVQDLLEERVI
ncbi:MAG: hypothetical protein AABY84_05615 [Candidatus Firestonebacteria bacterium]